MHLKEPLKHRRERPWTQAAAQRVTRHIEPIGEERTGTRPGGGTRPVIQGLPSARNQSGLTLSGMLLTLIVVAIVIVLGMRVIPDVVEYGKIVSVVKTLARDPDLRQASPADIRRAYENRAIVDNIKSVGPQDLDISKEDGKLVLSFAYTKRVPVAGPVSLLIDFEGSSGK